MVNNLNRKNANTLTTRPNKFMKGFSLRDCILSTKGQPRIQITKTMESSVARLKMWRQTFVYFIAYNS